jgi:hypothetical protein
VVIERRRHAEDDRIALGNSGEIGGRVEFARRQGFRDVLGRDVLDVAAAGMDRIRLRGIDIEADRANAGAGLGEHKRQTDVAETHDTDDGAAILEFFLESHAWAGAP